MSVFSQHNVSIYCQTLASILAIIVAIFPTNVVLTRKQKGFLCSAPAISNLAAGVMIIGDALKNRRYGVSKFSELVAQTDVWSFIISLLNTSLAATIIVLLFVLIVKRGTYNDKRLMRYYLKLTNKQKESGHITIIGGSLDFFGVRPCKSKADAFDDNTLKCKKTYDSKHKLTMMRKRFFCQKSCRRCCLNNEQWKQITMLIKKGCKLQIICTHPDNTETELYTKELLGFLLKAWEKGVSVRFFDNATDPHIRGRIIEDFSNVKQVCWNFKTTNGKKNSYEAPYTFSKNERMGAFVIYAFEKIGESAREMPDNEKTQYIEIFNNRE